MLFLSIATLAAAALVRGMPAVGSEETLSPRACANQPREWQIISFERFTSENTPANNYIGFRYLDAATGVNTWCEWDRAAAPSDNDAANPIYACDNEGVRFSFQTSPTFSLKLYETFCPSSPQEARAETKELASKPVCLEQDGGMDCKLMAGDWVDGTFTSTGAVTE